MVRVSNFGRTELFLKESSSKDLKSTVSLAGPMEHPILDNLNKIDLKERVSLPTKMEDTITDNGKTT